MARNVYVTRVIPQPGIDLLRDNASVEVNESDQPLTADQLREKASLQDALVTLLTDRIDRAVLEAGRGTLKIVANVAVGYDNIDVPAATECGVMVTNTPGVLTETTADFAWALLMATARRIPEGDRFLRAGRYHGWGIMMLLGQDVYERTLGIVGFGRIGQAVAWRAAGFRMHILYYDPVIQADDFAASVGARRVDLDTLLRESDFVSVHTPLTEETHHLIGAEQLSAMKRDAVLVNTSRGPVVDEAALAAALKSGTIAAAGLDVYENEPAVDPGLLECENAVLTPHIASASVATRTRMATMAAENVIAALDGARPPTLLNPETYRG
ncbi:MAG TPA: D-glycerate dehydrogenase [Chloroflexota bacterium]|nr:D-glycerate dehydrogenase [Chloroflexota bacterium]